MTFDLNSLKADKTLQEDGNWVKDILPDLHVKVRSTSSHTFKKRMAELLKPYQRLGKEPSLEQQEEVSAKAVAETLLLDWSGVVSDGKEVEYTVENAIALFTDIPEFLIAVSQAGNSLENFKHETDLVTSGNSETT